MKKLLFTLSTLAITSLSADIIRIEGALGVWNQEPSGTFEESITNSEPLNFTDTLGFTSSTNYYAWIYFKHFIPLVPNVRVESLKNDFQGNASASYTWDGVTYDADVPTSLQMTQYDAILYYNILDNTAWTTIDIGLDAKFFQTQTRFDSTEISNTDFVVPLIYARARVEIFSTGLAFEADAKGISYSSSHIYDIRAKVDYKFDFPIIQPGIELGYRYQSIEINSKDFAPIEAKTNLDIAGIYAGLSATF